MIKLWEEKEIQFLRDNYSQKGKSWCMLKLNRTEASIRKKASELRLKQDKTSDFFKDWQRRAAISKIGKKRPEQSEVMKRLHRDGKLIKNEQQIEAMRERVRKQWKKIPHPRGMLGKHHSDKFKKEQSIRSKRMWKNPNLYQNSKEYRQLVSNRQSKIMIKRIQTKGSVYSRSNNGWYIIGNQKHFFRSSWEVNYARYLEWLVNKQQILSWDYETNTFWFDKIKRGVRSYTPDFKIISKQNEIEFHEVKGWMDSKSITKIKRMAIYHPQVKLIVIDKDSYKNIIKFERMWPKAVVVQKV